MTEALGSAAAGNPTTEPASTAPTSGADLLLGQQKPANDATPVGTAANDNWYGKIGADPETAEWLNVKKFPDEKTAMASYRHLEKMIGAAKIAVPANDADTAGWDKLYNQLGRPDKPEGYGLDKVADADPAFSGAMSKAFHAAGISTKQSAKLLEGYQAYAVEQQKAAQQQFTDKSNQEISDFRKEQGTRFDATMELSKRVLRADGLNDDEVFAIENALGTGRMLRWLAKRGNEMAEDRAPDGTIKQDMSLSATGAKAKIDALVRDESFMKRYLSDDNLVRKPAIEEMERLHRLAAGVAA